MGVETKNFLFSVILGLSLQSSFGAIQNAGDRQFRFQASLRATQYGTHTCGGSLITEKWLLTTAACANKLDGNSFAWAGSTKTVDDTRLQSRRVNRIIKHEQFNSSNFDNNIAVVELTDSFVYNDNILNVRLPVAGQALADNAQLCGWKPPNQYLQVLDNIKLQISSCKTSAGIDVPLARGEFCGNTEDASPLNCINDLGGALSRDGVLQGLLSRTDCFLNPEIFIQVSAYSDWIKQTLGDDAKDIKWDNAYPGTGGGTTDEPDGASTAESSIFLVTLLTSLYVLFQNINRW